MAEGQQRRPKANREFPFRQKAEDPLMARGQQTPHSNGNTRLSLWGYKRLKNLLEKEPTEILFTLSQQRNDFIGFLKCKTIKPELMPLVFQVLCKICSSDHRSTLMSFLTMVNCQTHFLGSHVNTYLVNLQKLIREDDIHIKSLSSLVTFLKHIHLSIPQASHESILVVFTVLKSTLDSLQICNQTTPDDLKQSVEQLDSELKDFDEKRAVKSSAKNKLQQVAQQEPPNDFRTIPIFPQLEDIFGTEHFLRPNIVRGQYANCQHYLDVQFRLLREDFICPLREGILEYLQSLKDGAHKKVKAIRVYSDVHVVKSVLSNNGMSHVITFSTEKLKKVRWAVSKRLMYGSLVCLSLDNFNTMLLATITRRKVEDLEKGIVEVYFQNSADVVDISPLTAYQMTESSAYFEAYRHNLKVLQEIHEDNLPMKDYIVNVKDNVNPPAYLQRELTYELGSKELKVNTLPGVAPLDDCMWPTSSELGLDDSQYRALKNALTKEFCLIQGPPGTGKTYVGLRIVEILLNNANSWSQDDRYPILLVCYTNHALDQFVEGVSKFTDRIVRIGGKCRSEALSKFSLSNLRKTMIQTKSIPAHIRFSVYDSVNRLKMLEKELNNHERNIDETMRKVLLMDDLHHIIQARHIDSLEENCSGFSDPILEWLGIFQIRQRIKLDTFAHELTVPTEEGEVTDYATHEEDVMNTDPGIQEPQANLNVDKNDGPGEDDNTKGEDDGEDGADVEFIQDMRMVEDMDDNLRSDTDAVRLWDRNSDEEIVLDVQGEWQMQRGRMKKLRQYVQQQLKVRTDKMNKEEADEVRDVWYLDMSERWRLYRFWVGEYVKEMQTILTEARNKYSKEAEKYKEVLTERDVSVVRKTKVIAMTTTGAAKFHTMIEILQPRIVIVEEAAEVLEAHIVTSLTQNTQHLVLIGDHQQLRPTPTVYHLAKKFNLDISLFERMIKNGLPYSQLELQHRMRPEISSLLVPAIYPLLKNHESVNSYEHVKGISKDVFFITHTVPERHDEEARSFVNNHEANFIAELCCYLLLQGYDTSRITVLTMYSGQFFAIKQAMKKIPVCSGVRICVVDNFQGEESDIILLSFVRSNMEGSVGFLKTENRVCVALSRARIGMFCIGNFELLSEQSQLWCKIVKELENREALGESLSICCQNHPNKARKVKTAEEIRTLAPEGGCNQPCEYRLPCGHICPLSCHSYDREHAKYKCHKICKKTYTCEHQCLSRCHGKDPCPPCSTPLLKSRSCGHTFEVPCHMSPEESQCCYPCSSVLPCGHRCQNMCSDPCTRICRVIDDYVTPCGHSIRIFCCNATNTKLLLKICPKPCNTELKCGHICKGTCGTCLQGCLHVPCLEKCERVLVCGHTCKEPCSKECPPCPLNCENRCRHSKCPNACGAPCSPCLEKCTWRCKHYKCTKLCSEKCNRPPCNRPCNRKLKLCKHNCIGICGEPCPDKCRICNEQEVKDIFFGTEDEDDALFIQLEDCKHIFEIKGLTQWVESQNERTSVIQPLLCPKCKTPITRNVRFGNIIRKVLQNIEKVKVKYYGTLKENQEKKEILREKLFIIDKFHVPKFRNNSKRDLSLLLQDLHNLLKTKGKTSLPLLALIENKLNFIRHLLKLLRGLKNVENEKRVDVLPNIAQGQEYADDRIGEIIIYLRRCLTRISEQQLENINDEIHRLLLLIQALEWYIKNAERITLKIQEKYQLSLKSVMTRDPLTDEAKEEFKKHLQEANHLLGRGVLGITFEVKQQILKSVGLTQGHWYSCPNGHVYAVGDYGGAVMENKCNECGAPKGGRSHRLRSGNRVAAKMDGATHSACLGGK